LEAGYSFPGDIWSRPGLLFQMLSDERVDVLGAEEAPPAELDSPQLAGLKVPVERGSGDLEHGAKLGDADQVVHGENIAESRSDWKGK